MSGPATVKCGGGALGAAPRDDHPCLPLERTADGGLGRMFAANGMQPGDEYRSDEQGLAAVVSDEVDASWVFSVQPHCWGCGRPIVHKLDTPLTMHTASVQVIHQIAE